MSSHDASHSSVGQSGGPEAIEWQTGSPGIAVRGLIWRGEQLPVLFIHEPGPGHDLDRWGSLPEFVHRAGHTVVVFDLPGHGLSDGDPTEANARTAIEQIVQETTNAFGTALSIVTEGSGNSLLPQVPLRALIILSPRDTTGAQTGSPKLIFCGATDPASRDAADDYLRSSRGWTVISSFGTGVQGSALLETIHRTKIAAQIVSFLRDYS